MFDEGKLLNEGRKMQQLRIERLVRDHLVGLAEAGNSTTELEKIQQMIVRQFIDLLKQEGQTINGHESYLLK